MASREAPLGHSVKPCPIRTPLLLPPQTRSVHAVIFFFLLLFWGGQCAADVFGLISCTFTPAEQNSSILLEELEKKGARKRKVHASPSSGEMYIIFRS